MTWWAWLLSSVLVLALAAVVLRLRKLYRDAQRARYVAPVAPPSPYERAPGFRIVHENETPPVPRERARSFIAHRSEPFVFSDVTPQGTVPTSSSSTPADRFALAQASKGPRYRPLTGIEPRAIAVLGLLFAAIVVLLVLTVIRGH